MTPQTIVSNDDSVQVEETGSKIDGLADDDVSYDDVEAEGDQGDGAVDRGTGPGTFDKTLENPMNGSRDEMVKALSEDHSLDSLKKKKPTGTGGKRDYL